MSTSEKKPLTRLSEFRVERLFNEFDYVIPVHIEERITAIIAPNGSGKTVCLRLINALFRRQWSVFKSTEFRRAEYIFTDGRSVKVTKDVTEDTDEDKPSVSLGVNFTISPSDAALFDGLDVEWAPQITELQRSRIPSFERFVPYITRIGPNRWQHEFTGQNYSVQDMIENFSEQLPSNLISGIYHDEPDALKELIEAVDCHLIETQRLLILPSEERVGYRGERRLGSTLAIAQKAQALREIIARTLAEYANLSQSLDRSFPRRVIQQASVLPAENLKSTLQTLDEQRRQLMDAGILGAEGSEPVNLPGGEIEDAIARVLSVYATDTQRKLEYLSPLLEKVKLFKELIDQRFSFKQIEVDREAGFRVKFHGADVPLDKLSSGEQHQLVLFFELLFQLRSNALILIDEPELSLHVAWQRKFISDLNRIIGLNKFDVILATHSPQLIAHWENLVIELGDVDSDDADDYADPGTRPQ